MLSFFKKKKIKAYIKNKLNYNC